MNRQPATSAKLLDVLPHEVADAVTGWSQSRARVAQAVEQWRGGGAKPQAAVKKLKTDAKATFEQLKHGLADVGRLLSVAMLAVPQRIEALKAEIATLEKQLAEREAAGPLSGETLLESAEQDRRRDGGGVEVPGVEGNLMRQLIDQVRGKTSSSAVLLASRQGDDKVTLVAGISKDLQAQKAQRRRVDSPGRGSGWRRRRWPARYGAGGRQGTREVARGSPDCQRDDSQDDRWVTIA